MLQQIFMKTPIWVWPLLAFLIYRGVAASVDREVGLKRLFIIPAVMLALSIQGIASAFGADMAAAPVWLAGMLAGTAIAWYLFDERSVTPHPEKGSVAVRGSWSQMVLIMGIFMTKYAVNASLAMSPDLKQHLAFVATVCALYGVFNGVFIGQLLRVVSIYRGGQTPATHTARSHSQTN